MRKSAFQATLPAFTAVMQIGSPSSQFAGWVYLHSICSPHNTDHLPFGQNVSTAHASPLGYMLYTLNRFLRHLQPSPPPPCFGRGIRVWGLHYQSSPRVIVAAFVFLAADNFATFLVKHQLDAFLLAFLAFLLIRGIFLFASQQTGRFRASWRRGHPMRRHPWHVHHLPLLRAFPRFFLSRNLLLRNRHFFHCNRCNCFNCCNGLGLRLGFSDGFNRQLCTEQAVLGR